jgi:membrane protease YdiL (CAAX protease family)
MLRDASEWLPELLLSEMRALKSNPRTEEHAQAIEETEAAARLSLRTVTAMEIASVVSSVLIVIWIIAPFYPYQRWLWIAVCLPALALMLYSQWQRGERPRELGFTRRHFGRALRLLLAPTLFGAAAMIAIAYFSGSLQFQTRFWERLVAFLFWGLVQQYILQGFIYRRLKFIFVNEDATADEQARRTRRAIFASALLFGLIHAPNLTLMGLTLAAGLIWSWVYERAPNLFALSLSHSLLSAVAMASLPEWLLPSMSVGYKHFLYQTF